MGLYLYQHPESLEVKEIFQGMNEEHVYTEERINWNRIFTVPGAGFDNRIDPWSKKDFLKATANKSGKLRDLQEISKELGEKRGGVSKQDPIREKYYQEYAETRNGHKHRDVKKRESSVKLAKLGYELE